MDMLIEKLGEQGLETLQSWIGAFLILVVGLILSSLLSRGIARFLGRTAGDQHVAVLRRIVFYGLALVTIGMVLTHLGFDLTVLLGAAGVLTVAIGFASQTSASNVISGLFLLGERPFVVGDVLRIDQITGEVVSIDLLSVKLRTFDNLSVRVPNETLLKTNFTNLTHYPIRRYDLQLRFELDEDLNRVEEALFAVADSNPLCLDEPRPLFIFQGFGDSWLNVQFSVWASTKNYLEIRAEIIKEIKAAFENEGIESPLPRRVISGIGADSAVILDISQDGRPRDGAN